MSLWPALLWGRRGWRCLATARQGGRWHEAVVVSVRRAPRGQAPASVGLPAVTARDEGALHQQSAVQRASCTAATLPHPSPNPWTPPLLTPQARTSQLSKVKASNRQAEKEAGVAEGAVPRGSAPWERVLSVVDLGVAGNTSKDPFKELSRWGGVRLWTPDAILPVDRPPLGKMPTGRKCPMGYKGRLWVKAGREAWQGHCYQDGAAGACHI